jgi:predicted membrane-bound dolichyl-phosphate-mannose-protein mannosyltransferase
MLSAIGHHPRRVLVVLLAIALVLRLIWLWWPHGATIFDEAFYVNAARVILGRDVADGQPYASAPLGLDPNTEHPPLGKVLVAGSMLLLGDGGIGWRAPSVIASMIALAAVYLVVRRLGGSEWLGVGAVFLLAAENLTFVHGRIATLDMLFLAPMLAAAWLALDRRWVFSGVTCAIAALIKLSAGFGLLAIVLFELIRALMQPDRGAAFRRLVAPVGSFLVASGLTFVLGLWLLDQQWSSFRDPFAHLSHMLAYGASLQAPQPTGIASYPWQWLVNQGQIHYLTVTVDSAVGGVLTARDVTIDFQGALSPTLLVAAPVSLGAAGWWVMRSGSPIALWCLAWAAATFLPYVVLALVAHRITYLYYVLPVIPAIAVAMSLLLAWSRQRLLQAAFVVAHSAAFVAYFPFRQLP